MIIVLSASSYFHLANQHCTDEGYMKLNSPPDPENVVDLNEAIVQSVNVANGMN